MKKTIIILTIFILVLSLNKHEKYRIPKESIRFRVVANTNDANDQKIKRKVVKNLKTNLLKTNKFKNIEETRNYMKNELPEFTNIVEKTLKDNNYDKNFHINYGKNYFPQKTYENELYPQGEYESLVVTLGDGEGDNFWCVLFPPLCFNETKDYHYKSLIKEIINKIFE
ncbi:MAG: stage II sporulation protein R [Bacilli bacterium]|nr:stage II sporulation protein R [Bacilli bacterium]